MNVNERIQLQKMLQEGDSEDYTEKIREVKIVKRLNVILSSYNYFMYNIWN